MKKNLLALVISFALLLSSFSTSAQAYKEGDKLLNIGIGINSYYTGGIPIGASLEFGVTDKISVGPSIDFVSHSYSYLTYTDKFTTFYLGGRASYHFDELLQIDQDNIDIYGGLDLGYRSFSWNNDYTGSPLSNVYTSGLYVGLHVGGRYYFDPTIAAFAELGATGSTNARIGVSFKL